MSTYPTKKYLLLAICCILILAYLIPRYTSITSDDGVISTDIITLRNSIPGFVTIPPSIRPGTLVKKGTLLYIVDNSLYGNIDVVAQYHALKNQLNTLTADRKSLEIDLVQHNNDYRRFSSLVSKKTASKEQLEQIKTNRYRVKSLVKIKKQQEINTNEDLADINTQLNLFKNEEGKSLIEGVVWSVITRSSEYKENASPLLEIIDKNKIRVDAYFSEKHADYLKPQLPVIIQIVASGEKLKGEIEFIRSGIGRILFNNPIQTPPESFKERMVVVRISINTISVPIERRDT